MDTDASKLSLAEYLKQRFDQQGYNNDQKQQEIKHWKDVNSAQLSPFSKIKNVVSQNEQKINPEHKNNAMNILKPTWKTKI